MGTALRILVIMGVVFINACQSKQTGSAANQRTDTTHARVQPTDAAIAYQIAQRYFVKNSVSDLPNPSIDSQPQFDQLFGAATRMGQDGKPTAINFDKQFVIAVIEPRTNQATTLTPVSLQKDTNGDLLFSYRKVTGENQSSLTIPSLLIIVDKGNYGKVRLRKID